MCSEFLDDETKRDGNFKVVVGWSRFDNPNFDFSKTISFQHSGASLLDLATFALMDLYRCLSLVGVPCCDVSVRVVRISNNGVKIFGN